jgi:hypothetical protein
LKSGKGGDTRWSVVFVQDKMDGTVIRIMMLNMSMSMHETVKVDEITGLCYPGDLVVMYSCPKYYRFQLPYWQG